MTQQRSILVFLLLLLLSGSVLAQPQRRSEQREKMKAKLNLSEEQERSLAAIRLDTKTQMIDLKAAMQKKRLYAETLTDDPSASRQEVEATLKDIASLQVQMKMLLFDADKNVIAELTLEQQNVWKDIKKMRKAGMREGFRRGMKEGFRGKRHRCDDDCDRDCDAAGRQRGRG